MAQTHTFSLADFLAVDPEGGKGGRWLCPAPECAKHTDPRRHRSVGMVSETGLWQCNRCHARGQLKERWKPMQSGNDTRESWKERKAKVEKAREKRIMDTIGAPALPTMPESGISPAEVRYRVGTLAPLASVPVAVQFLDSRGFSREVLPILHAAGVRYAHDYGRKIATPDEPRPWQGTPAIVFPIRNQHGELVAAQGRVIAPGEGMPKALTFGHRAFGVFKALASPRTSEGRLAICEGPLDALALAVTGVDAVALCGCNGLPAWFLLASCGRRYLIATDADDAGDIAALKIARELTGAGATTTRLRPYPEKSDFADMLKWGTLIRAATATDVDDLSHAIRALLRRETLTWPHAESVPHGVPLTLLNESPKAAIESLITECALDGDTAQRAVDVLADVVWWLTDAQGGE